MAVQAGAMSLPAMREVVEAWARLEASMSVSYALHGARTADPGLAGALRVIEQHRLTEYAVTWFLDAVSAAASADIAPKFWAYFDGFTDVRGSKGAGAWASDRVSAALLFLTSALDAYMQVARAMESNSDASGKHYGVVRKCRTNLSAVVFSSVPRHFNEILYMFLSKQFADFARDARPSAVEDDDGSSSDAEDDDDCMNADTGEGGPKNFRQVWLSIHHVGAFVMAEEVLTEVLYDKISQRVHKRCAQQWDRPVLGKDIENWAARSVWPLLRQLRRAATEGDDASQDAAMEGEEAEGARQLGNDKKQWEGYSDTPTAQAGGASDETSGSAASGWQFGQVRARLELFMYETFTNLRISELFDIIVDYPDSQPALHDLKASLSKTHQYARLVTELRAALETRLLHAGANTSDILTQYISTIKALHELDPSGTTLGAISLPVQLYLRGRQDTVRCIVTGLTDDTGSDLFQELRKGTAAGGEGRGWRWRPRAMWQEEAGATVDGAADSDGDDEVEEDGAHSEAAMRWTPDALQPGPCSDLYHKGSVDIIGMLVDIYGSTDLFLNEYRALLSDKLLALTSYQIDREVHNVELLKIRFGEGSLHKCEVMLKDVGDSKRLDAYVHKESDKQTLAHSIPGWLDAKILSGAFWPQLSADKVSLHPRIQEHLTAYSSYYSLLKKPRSLQWRPTLGVTKLNLSFEDGRVVSVSVSPLLANLILHFETQPTWTLAQLAEATSSPVELVRKRMVYWVGCGVCSHTAPPAGAAVGETTYSIIENAESAAGHKTHFAMEEEEDAEANADDGQEAVIHSYITGMLTNFKALPLDRIHNMLKMFVTDPPYTKKITELAEMLDKLVAADKLEIVDNNYTIKPQ